MVDLCSAHPDLISPDTWKVRLTLDQDVLSSSSGDPMEAVSIFHTHHSPLRRQRLHNPEIITDLKLVHLRHYNNPWWSDKQVQRHLYPYSSTVSLSDTILSELTWPTSPWRWWYRCLPLWWSSITRQDQELHQELPLDWPQTLSIRSCFVERESPDIPILVLEMELFNHAFPRSILHERIVTFTSDGLYISLGWDSKGRWRSERKVHLRQLSSAMPVIRPSPLSCNLARLGLISVRWRIAKVRHTHMSILPTSDI